VDKKQRFHIAGLLVGSLIASAIARVAAYGDFFSHYGVTERQQQQELIQWLAASALIFIPALVISHWKGMPAGYLAMVFIAALIILGGWPK